MPVRLRRLPLRREAARLLRSARRLHHASARPAASGEPRHGPRRVHRRGPTSPPTRTGSGSSRKVGVSVPMMSSPIPMPRGVTARPSRRARAVASTATRWTWRSARAPAYRWPGTYGRRGTQRLPPPLRCSTRFALRLRSRDGGDGQGLRREPRLRRLRGPGHPADRFAQRLARRARGLASWTRAGRPRVRLLATFASRFRQSLLARPVRREAAGACPAPRLRSSPATSLLEVGGEVGQ